MTTTSRPRQVLTLGLAAALVAGAGAAGALLGRAGASAAPAPGPLPAALVTDEVLLVEPVGLGDGPRDDGFGQAPTAEGSVVPFEDDLPRTPVLDLSAPPVDAPEAVLAVLGRVPDEEVVVPDVVRLPSGSSLPEVADETDLRPVPPADDAAEPAADPCAPTDGPPADDCPDGVRSTVLASTAPPALEVFSVVDPPRWADGDEGVRPLAHCPPALTLGDDEALVTVVTNAPAVVTLAVWSTSLEGPGPERVLELRTDEAVAARWHADLEAGRDLADRWAQVQHCFVVDGLDAGARYGMRADVVDDFGRTGRTGGTLPGPTGGTGGLTVPPTRVVPLTSSRVLVSAPHRADQHVDLRAWTVEPGAVASCTAPAGARQLWGAHPVAAEVPADQLERRGHRPEYVRRTSTLIGVPEASTVVICLRWYDGGGPSWDYDRPDDARAVVLDTPDLVTPVITLESVDLTRAVEPGSVGLGVSVGGFGCGDWVGPAADGTATAPGEPLCDPAAGPAHLHQGLDRHARVDVRYSPEGGPTVTTSALLRTAARVCPPGCTLPETAWYRIPLPAVRVSSGLCDGEGCTPPTRENTLGSALLRVDFSAGVTPGGDRSRWSTGDLVDARTPRESSAAPRLDTFAQPRVTGTAARPTVEVALRADRPVSWSATWHGCAQDGATSSTEIAAPSTGARVVLGPLCPATTGYLEVTLTAADGSTSTWGPSRELYGEGFWPLAEVWVPGVPTMLDVTLEATPRTTVVVDSMQVTVDSSPVPWPRPTRDCADPGGLRQQGLGQPRALGDRVEVEVTVVLRTAEAWSGAGPDTCAPAAGPAQVVTFRATVDRADLHSGPFTVTTGPDVDPAVPFDVRLTLEATR